MSQRWMVIGMVLLSGSAARADLEPERVVGRAATEAQRTAARTASDAAQALTRGDFNGALDLTSRALAASAADPWAHYVRAAALVHLARLDEALTEFRLAEQNFPREDRWSRSIAIWGRANVFHQAGRCDESKAVLAEYLKLVGNDDRPAAELAQKEIDGCRAPWVASTPVRPNVP